MLIITTNNQYYTINGMSTEQWLQGQIDNKIPDDVLATVEDDNPLYAKIMEMAAFNPILDDDGKLIDIQEIEPEFIPPTPEQIIATSLINLDETDYKVIKNAEVIAIFLKEQFGLKFPYDPVEVHKEKQSYRDAIAVQEELINEESFNTLHDPSVQPAVSLLSNEEVFTS